MKWYCEKCRTYDHWANEVCAKYAGTEDSGVEVVSTPAVGVSIRQAEEFIKRVGRPRTVKDKKAHRREYMKSWRSKK